MDTAMTLSEYPLWDYDGAKERSLNQDPVLAQVMRSYIEDSDQLLVSLYEAIDARDAERTRFHAHALKGSSANVAAPRLSELARQIEFAAKANDFDQIDQLLVPFKQTKEALYQMVNEFLDYIGTN